MLQAQIKELQQQFLQGVPQETLNLIQETNAALAASGILDGLLKEGEVLPDFALHDASGELVQSRNLLGKGPLVICFYRGDWCPYCNLELRAYQQLLPEIEAQGAQLVAISPNLPDYSLDTIARHALRFPVLSDPGNQVARQFGLVFKLDARLLPLYQQLGLDIPAYNGDDSYELPLPATYVVDRDGIVRLAYADADYAKRQEPWVVVELLKVVSGRTQTVRGPMHDHP